MASNGRSNEDSAISEINVVPLVDIILVVLIIFMVTAPMIMKPSINVNLPKAATGDKTTPTQLQITIAASGNVFVNGKAATDEYVRSESLAAFQKNAEIQAIIAADKDVPHGKVIAVLDLVKSVGIKKFAISIDKQK